MAENDDKVAVNVRRGMIVNSKLRIATLYKAVFKLRDPFCGQKVGF